MAMSMFAQLQEISRRPAPFEHYTAADLWTDEHTSSRMLDHHLNGSSDVSSRNTEFIEKSVAWIVRRFELAAKVDGAWNLHAATLDEELDLFVCFSSAASLLGSAGQANYAASKAGVIGLTKTLAIEFARSHITVNAIAPGFIDTDMTRAVPEKARQHWIERIPVGRPGTADDVAGAVMFLASDKASYITGEVVEVDGGLNTPETVSASIGRSSGGDPGGRSEGPR